MTYSTVIRSLLLGRPRKANDSEQTLQWFSRLRRRYRTIDDEALKLQRLCDVFPDHSDQSLLSALTRSGGSVEAAAEQLLSSDSSDEKERGMVWSTFKKAAQAEMLVLDKDGWERAPWEISASGGSSSTGTHGNTTNNMASFTAREAGASSSTIDGAKSITAEWLHQRVDPGKGKKKRDLTFPFLFISIITALVFSWMNVIFCLLFLLMFAASVGMIFSSRSKFENRGVTQGSETKIESRDNDLIECGCCFENIPFGKCTFCGDGHLFCMDCARKNAEHQIGMRRTELLCLDTSGCQFAFSHSEIQRFLPPNLYEAFMRVVQAEELHKANLPDLVSCPFCDFAAIVPAFKADDDKNFQCQNPSCGIVSCRACQDKAHATTSCEQERELEKEHKVEEAMTDALLRECPKCKKKFYKTEGCNFMMCHCGQAMCYICRIPIMTHDHFSGTCVLFDDTIKRNANDVAAAEKVARAATQPAEKVAPATTRPAEKVAHAATRKENLRTDWFWFRGRN